MTLTHQSINNPQAAVATSTDSVAPSPRIVLATAYRMGAESIAWCLAGYGSFRDVQSVDSVKELLEAIRTQQPRIVVLGEKIVTEGFREVLGELAVKMGETRVAVFADSLTDRQLDLVANNRIAGLLSRKDNIGTLNEQLVRITSGTNVLSPHLSDRVELGRNGDFKCVASVHLRKLTDRQWDVLLRIAQGRRVSEVADELEISSKAVESHKYRIMKTVGATDRVGLCRWAIREGLIDA
ncbi:MAG: response regulator transcription factor [Fuerstiella sp.]